jgi:hypothetical protein
MFAAIPLLVLPVVVYNLLVLAGGQAGDPAVELNAQAFAVTMASGRSWVVSTGDLLLAGSLIILFIELLKSTTSRRAAIINHSLSMVLFVACLVEFLLLRGFATSIFFLITLMVLLDVLAGFIVTIVSARRDFAVAPDEVS